VRPAEPLSRLRNLGFQEVTAPGLTFEQVRVDRDALEVVGTRPALGTLVSVTAISSSSAHGEVAIAAAFAELDRLVEIFSRHEPDSALSTLNDAGHLTGPPPELVRVLERSRYFHALSQGAFDVTVKPVLDLLGLRFPATAPTAGELRDVAALVGAEHLTVKRRRIRFARGGMGVTLDGIAKGYIVDRMADVLGRHEIRRFLINAGGDIRARGYIVDRMADVLGRHEIRRFLINAGGDIRARGLKESRRPWMVGVRDPSTDAVLPDVIALQDGAVATSGSYERFFDPAHRFHHIIDPASGQSPSVAWSVSVTAPTALAADALATTVFVLGPEAGMRLLEALPECAGFILTEGGVQRRSSRWPGLTIGQKESIV